MSLAASTAISPRLPPSNGWRRARTATPTLVFNGDFHWFDAEPDWFAQVERRVTPHLALRGNVETEVARNADIGAGCGCAYPESVDADVVSRSNVILRQLRPHATPRARARLGALPMHLVAQVGDLRIGIVHGDAGALAGWRFAQNALDDPANVRWLTDMRAASQVDVFASTHTCLAALRDFDLPSGRLTVINNGAAGMPNFSGSRIGVITRIATTPSPYRTLYGLQRDGVYIDALAVPYDQDAFLGAFPGPLAAGLAGLLVLFPAHRRGARPSGSRRRARHDALHHHAGAQRGRRDRSGARRRLRPCARAAPN